MPKLNIGDKAPDFTAKDQAGEDVKLSQYKGKKVVLFFYPKDNTETCTKEACNLRDNYDELLAKGYEVIGVSIDGVKSHKRFASKYALPYHIVSDEDKKIVEAYGVWGEKVLFGRHYMGTLRTTFVIDEKGKIADIIDKVDSKNHASQVLK